ncbi:MAG: PP2C family protein-serine/threonine phosphatase [Pseudonocardia sp.]
MAARSDVGSYHDDNQDRMLADAGAGWCVVADGIGGLADAGATAQIVVDELPGRVLARIRAHEDIGRAARAATAEVNDRVRATARHGPGTTGATAALLIVGGGCAITVHVGDSRIYLARDGRLSRLTVDHALPSGELTRFVGMPGCAEPDASLHAVSPGDRLLLCTDGLVGSLDDEDVRRLLGARPPDAACRELVAAARVAGAVDDVTVIVVEVTS